MAAANQEIRDLKAELEELRASIRSEVKNGHFRAARDEVEHFASNVRDDAKHFAHDAGVTLRQAWGKSRGAAVDAYANYENSVARHPLPATAIAFAGGILFAALLRRR